MMNYCISYNLLVLPRLWQLLHHLPGTSLHAAGGAQGGVHSPGEEAHHEPDSRQALPLATQLLL